MYRFSSFSAPFASLLLIVIFVGCDVTTPTDDTSNSEIESQVQEALGSQVTDFQVRELDVAAIAEELEAGETTLPLVTPDNEITEVTLGAQAANLRADSVEEGVLRGGEGDVERVPLPPEQSYLLGDCTEEGEDNTCGGLTVLDDGQTMLQGAVRHPDFGVSYVESVNHVLETQEYPNYHVVYNKQNTEPIEFFDSGGVRDDSAGSDQKAIPRLKTDGSTSVVLDGDVEFYEKNRNTVWRRQENLFLMVFFTTAINAPLSGGKWGLNLSIAGQEVWVEGGPSDVLNDDLLNEVTDPDYFLIHPISDKQLHLFLTGKDIEGIDSAGNRTTGALGKAAGIGDEDGFGGTASSRNNHLISEADSPDGTILHQERATLTHEVGHLLGGEHGEATNGGCSGAFCGCSIMNQTATCKQSFFFSDDNDEDISDVIDATLP